MSISRRTACAVSAAALLASVAAPASAAPNVSKPAPKPNPAATQYVAVTKAGALQLVDRRTGKILRTVATAPRGTEFIDGAIAPDGTVWAVRQSRGWTNTSLLKIVNGRSYEFSKYARSVRVSPDGKRVMYTVISPDVDRDGWGAQSIRVANTKGAAQVRSLTNERIPMRRGTGEPMAQVSELRVSTWLDNDRAVVNGACCDSGRIAIVNRASSRMAWTDGTRAHRPIAKQGNTFYAPIERDTFDRKNQAWVSTAFDIYRFSAAQPKGVKVGRVNAPMGDESQLRRWVAQRPALVSLDESIKRLPYKGTNLAHQFLG